jgi:hypothetical protein
MNYIYSNDGLDVKVIYPTGQTKFVPKHIAENPKRRKSLGFEIMEAPLKAEPLFLETETDIEAVATPAKRGRKPKL